MTNQKLKLKLSFFSNVKPKVLLFLSKAQSSKKNFFEGISDIAFYIEVCNSSSVKNYLIYLYRFVGGFAYVKRL